MSDQAGREGAMDIHFRTQHRAGDEIELLVGRRQKRIVRDGFLQAHQGRDGEITRIDQGGGRFRPGRRGGTGPEHWRPLQNARKDALRGGAGRGNGEQKDGTTRDSTSAAGPQTQRLHIPSPPKVTPIHEFLEYRTGDLE